MTQPTLKIGTRGSPLALAQAYETRARLMAAHDMPEDRFEIVVIKTTGDKIQDRPLGEIGGKGLFTKEIEDALLDGSIDMAVHSMKDMPVEQPAGLTLDCYLPREDVRDAFVSLKYKSIADLPKGAKLGSSSLRRRAQILNRRPDIEVVEFRGNVQTRLRKLEEGIADATFLAMAGLNRLDNSAVAQSAIETDDLLPAVAQGAIGIERHKDNQAIHDMLQAIADTDTKTRLAAERSFLKALDGSCQTPIAGLATLNGDSLTLQGQILRIDGSDEVSGTITGPAKEGLALGQKLAADLLVKSGGNFF
ncbi:hydroxymethylbilane synthase [Amylibacter sp. SFDW26]|uniref:hydroxymethylbilane synthase n=1 Tax=Amylibacter sp. SFDW26 TaxID=2652722 RepID=UPI0012621412|nr:hydroxymethylbilane synthase [Amylibacter sp. SFDW26]KAB7615565.1 hydroxymethylbilane synthase [Amylibacter sp. SFDW26]